MKRYSFGFVFITLAILSGDAYVSEPMTHLQDMHSPDIITTTEMNILTMTSPNKDTYTEPSIPRKNDSEPVIHETPASKEPEYPNYNKPNTDNYHETIEDDYADCDCEAICGPSSDGEYVYTPEDQTYDSNIVMYIH